MKKDIVIRSILFFVFWCLFVYALFSFIIWDFNAANWDFAGRLFCGMSCFPLGMFATVMFNLFLEE